VPTVEPPSPPGTAGVAPGRSTVARTILIVVALLAGLPLAVWLDLRHLTEESLRAQAAELGRAIDGFRSYYNEAVVQSVKAGSGATPIVHNYRDVVGAIPVPATLSLELGEVIRRQDDDVRYRFFSDFEFKGRAPHAFDDFELKALSDLRHDASQVIWDVSGSILDRRVRRISPIVMEQGCVSCHNGHPASPKTDWKVGDVRGIQEIDVRRTIGTNVLSFRHLLVYFAAAAVVGIAFIALQRRQAALVRGANAKLGEANAFLGALSQKLGKYLSPQLYRGIFRGEMDTAVATQRKRLTIFFSDIVDFTPTTERLEPEALTSLLNEYLTEMSAIAVRHGGTIDKFIGDAILVFFGDPETRGPAGDAEACVRMAIEMQRRLVALDARWRSAGVEKPFRARMGINSGYCDVGNFGSDDRMEYTIIGGEANLSARLQTIAPPGGIVLSYEAYALVRDVVVAHPMEPIQVKGIARPIVPYVVDGLVGEAGQREQVVSRHGAGLELFVDAAAVAAEDAPAAIEALKQAVAALEARRRPDAS
jgi:class 3 adenylate cyclase